MVSEKWRMENHMENEERNQLEDMRVYTESSY